MLFTFSTNLSYTVFITPLSLFKSTGSGANLSISSLSTLLFKLLFCG